MFLYLVSLDLVTSGSCLFQLIAIGRQVLQLSNESRMSSRFDVTCGIPQFDWFYLNEIIFKLA